MAVDDRVLEDEGHPFEKARTVHFYNRKEINLCPVLPVTTIVGNKEISHDVNLEVAILKDCLSLSCWLPPFLRHTTYPTRPFFLGS